MISFIDPEKCTGCGTCFKTCPLDVFRLDTEQREISPCTHACPAGTDIRACHYLLQQGRTEDALAVLKRTMPLPAVTGRVCFHPCERACTRKDVDEALNINALEQFLGDLDLSLPATPFLRRHLSRVAVVGSGPAGLAAAWYLAEAGYHATVFESMPEPGGMLRYGIPACRLPDEVMEQQIRKFQDAGVEFVCSEKIGGNGWLTGLKAEGFQAAVLAVGASEGRLPGVPGEKASGVMTGLDFLRALRSGEAPLAPVGPGRRVLVVGGGDVAMDAAGAWAPQAWKWFVWKVRTRCPPFRIMWRKPWAWASRCMERGDRLPCAWAPKAELSVWNAAAAFPCGMTRDALLRLSTKTRKTRLFSRRTPSFSPSGSAATSIPSRRT